MNKNYVSALILFSLFGFSQDEISFDNETLSMFDGVISYDQKMNDLNNLVANREQAILRGDYGHSKEKKKALLKRLHQRAKISGTGRTLQTRQHFVEYLQSLGGEMGEGKLPLNSDGSINENFKGRFSDYDLQCKPVNCEKIQKRLLASGKFELRETNPGTFDIVAKSGGKNDMVKITFNVDDPDGKKVTRSEKINNVETYTAVQIKQQYGDYQGNKSYEEALKAKEHAFKGGAKNNNDLICFSHACDEAFNTSTKTAHKLIKDAPSFVDDYDIQQIIDDAGLKKDDGSPISSKEYKKLLEDSYSGQLKKSTISLEVNDLDTFLQVRNKIVKQTINKIETIQTELYNGEITQLDSDLKAGKITQNEFNNRMNHLNEINQNLNEYSKNSNYQKIKDADVDANSSSQAIKNLYKSSSIPRTSNADSLLAKGKKINDKLTSQMADIDSGLTGKRMQIVNKAGMVIGFYDIGAMVAEHCSDPEVCAEVMATVAKDIAVETIVDTFISKGIPVYGHLKESWEAGYYVGEQINEHILGIKIKDCKLIDGQQICNDITIKEKFIQNPLAEKMDEFNGTPEQMKKGEFMIAAANTCKDYLKTLQRANKNCMNMANKIFNESVSNDNEVYLGLLGSELYELESNFYEEDRQAKESLKDALGCDINIENDCENLTLAENETKKTDDTSLILEEENNPVISNNDWEDIDNFDQLVEEEPDSNKVAEISTTNSTKDSWDSLDEYDDLINNKNEDKAWMLREQIANNSKESSIQSTNQIRETGKEIAKIRKEAAIASQQALAEGLNSLAMGLSAVQQQQRASDQRLKQQAKAIEEQNSRTINNLANQIQPNHNNISSCVGSDGYPITDPYVCKALQNNSKTNNSYIPEQNSFNNNYGNCMSPEGYPLDPYLCKYQARNPSIPGNSTINNPTPTSIKQSVEINDKCEGGSEIDKAACELAGEFSGVSTYSQKSSISENRNESIHLEQVCNLDFFNSDNSWVYETPSPSMPIFKKVYIDGDPWGEDVPIDVPPVIECYNKNRTKVARHAIENNLSMVMDQYFKILEIAAKKHIPRYTNLGSSAEWGARQKKFMKECEFVFNETISNIKSLILSRASEKIYRMGFSRNTPLTPVYANNGTAEWQLDEEAAIDFAIDLVRSIRYQVSIEAESEFNKKYNIDENESIYDQLKAKNLFICGCESVRMEVQKALGFWDRTFFVGLRNSSTEHCRANDDWNSWNNNSVNLDLNGSILIKKEWKGYYGYE